MKKRICRVVLNKNGSISLETALVLPIFLILMAILVNLVNIAGVKISMDHAVGETAKELAVYSYAGQKFELQGILPSNVFAETIQKYLKSSSASGLEVALRILVQKRMQEYYPLARADTLKFKITDFKFYNPLKPSYKEVSITVQYKINIFLPFLSERAINLTSNAAERVWMN